MIVRHQNLEVPHGNSTLWRYTSLDKFIDLVMTSELFFANAQQMTDKYEGTIPEANQLQRSRQLKEYGKDTNSIGELISNEKSHSKRHASQTLMNCRSINRDESYALWKIYLGGEKNGIAIKSTVSRPERAINNGQNSKDINIYLGKVHYENWAKDLNRYTVIATKKKFYDYEKELRLLMFTDEALTGYRVNVFINDLVENIYLSPFSGRWFDNSFIKLLKKINPDFEKRIKISDRKDE